MNKRYRHKMKEIINKVLLAEHGLMAEIHFRQPGFTYRACVLFTKNNERIGKFKEAGDSRYIYQNQLEKSLLSGWYAL